MNTNLFQGELVRLVAQDPEKDAETMTRWYRDTEFARLLDSDPARPTPLSRGRAMIEQDQAGGGDRPVFFIRTLADDKLIGLIGLSMRWSNGEAWVFVGLGEREYWGKGYGTDAMRVILRYAFTEANVHRVTLGVFGYNRRAIRSYEKAGFTVEGRVRQILNRDGERHDEFQMGILREEWLKSQNPKPKLQK